MIFSDNVPLEDELALKQRGARAGRLVMGPDCGTAIIGGVPLAFANRVRRGDIGIIGASGTGMQEVTSLIARGRRGHLACHRRRRARPQREVGGITTLMAIDALDADPATRRIVLISKPPHPEVARAVLARVGQSTKRFTICFLGGGATTLPAERGVRADPARTRRRHCDRRRCAIAAERRAARRDAARPGRIVGLFSGGTLCAEAQLILLGRRPQRRLQRCRSRRASEHRKADGTRSHRSISAPTNSRAAARIR